MLHFLEGTVYREIIWNSSAYETCLFFLIHLLFIYLSAHPTPHHSNPTLPHPFPFHPFPSLPSSQLYQYRPVDFYFILGIIIIVLVLVIGNSFTWPLYPFDKPQLSCFVLCLFLNVLLYFSGTARSYTFYIVFPASVLKSAISPGRPGSCYW